MAAIALQPVPVPAPALALSGPKRDPVQVETHDHLPTPSGSDRADSDSEPDTSAAATATATAPAPTEPEPEPAAWTKREDVPYWARIYPVTPPPFQQSAKGHPADRHAPHPDDEFPLSAAGPEERARRQKELDDLYQLSLTKRPLDEDFEPNYKYQWALPWFDERYKSKYFKDPHFKPFPVSDVGRRALAHSDPEAFLNKKGVRVEELSPGFGTVVYGLDLTTLTPDEKDELSLLISQRGVVVFEDQDNFIDQSPEQFKAFGAHFSPHQHQHQVSGQPKDHPEFHLVYRSPKWPLDQEGLIGRFSNKAWHSDVSFEAQPAGITALFLFDAPPTGGDTLFVDTEEVLRRLSPSFRAYLSTLEAEHDGFPQVAQAARSKTGVARRPAVAHVHPLIRTHPVTGRESLFVSETFTSRILGLKDEESDAILALLKRLVNETLDAQLRVRWGNKSVVWWDNRRTLHSASYAKAANTFRRHGARITPQAERPFYQPRPRGFFAEDKEPLEEKKVEV